MKWIALLAAKLAVFALIGYGLYVVSQLNRRSVTAWTTDSPDDVGKPVSRGRSVSFTSEPRRAASEPSCAAQTWPNITSACITGHVQPARPAPAANTAPAAAAPVTPPAALAARAQSEPAEPAHTGSLPTVASDRLDRAAPGRKIASTSREGGRTARIRNRAHAPPAARPIRWASRPRPLPFYAQRRPSRVASAPWSNPNQYWRDGRPE